MPELFAELLLFAVLLFLAVLSEFFCEAELSSALLLFSDELSCLDSSVLISASEESLP